MDSYMPLLMVTLCACVCGEPLQAALLRRSELSGGGGVYARHHARGYKPLAFAAISLHAPIPMLHIMSPVPLTPDAHDSRAAASEVMPTYAQPLYAADTNAQQYSSQVYAASPNTPPYSTHVYAVGTDPQPYSSHFYSAGNNARPYNPLVYSASANAKPYNPHKYASSVNDIIRDSSSESDEPIVLYARPNPQGGYSYRRRPTKKRAPRPERPERPEPEPVIIRVQKYRIIRDR